MTMKTPAPKPSRRTAWLLIAVIAPLVSYIGGCELISSSRNKAFEAVQIGDPEASVIARLT